MIKVLCLVGSFRKLGPMLPRPSAVYVGAILELSAGVALKLRLSYGRGGGPLANVSSHCAPPVVSPAWIEDQPITYHGSWIFVPASGVHKPDTEPLDCHTYPFCSFDR